MYAPFRDKKPWRIESNAYQTQSVKTLTGEVIKLIKRSGLCFPLGGNSPGFVVFPKKIPLSPWLIL
jgi:hypothetical protein